MSEIEMTREELADYFEQHTGALKALLAQKDALLVRAADALEGCDPKWEGDWSALIAELRKAAE